MFISENENDCNVYVDISKVRACKMVLILPQIFNCKILTIVLKKKHQTSLERNVGYVFVLDTHLELGVQKREMWISPLYKP